MTDTRNALIVGFDKTAILRYLPARYLLIDDGHLIDQIPVAPRRSVTVFDAHRHTLNPLKGMDYRKATEFLAILDALFPEGENTLTRKHSNFVLLNALLDNAKLYRPKRLERLQFPIVGASKEGILDAFQKKERLLLSPVLKRVLNAPTNLSFKGTIHARLNRAELGDFDCFVLGNLLISQYDGPVVIPDFGFYGIKPHVRLIRQDRLIAGVNALAECDALRHQLLAIETKEASFCTAEDARTLAIYAGKIRDTIDHSDFIFRSIHPQLSDGNIEQTESLDSPEE